MNVTFGQDRQSPTSLGYSGATGTYSPGQLEVEEQQHYQQGGTQQVQFSYKLPELDVVDLNLNSREDIIRESAARLVVKDPQEFGTVLKELSETISSGWSVEDLAGALDYWSLAITSQDGLSPSEQYVYLINLMEMFSNQKKDGPALQETMSRVTVFVLDLMGDKDVSRLVGTVASNSDVKKALEGEAFAGNFETLIDASTSVYSEHSDLSGGWYYWMKNLSNTVEWTKLLATFGAVWKVLQKVLTNPRVLGFIIDYPVQFFLEILYRISTGVSVLNKLSPMITQLAGSIGISLGGAYSIDKLFDGEWSIDNIISGIGEVAVGTEFDPLHDAGYTGSDKGYVMREDEILEIDEGDGLLGEIGSMLGSGGLVAAVVAGLVSAGMMSGPPGWIVLGIATAGVYWTSGGLENIERKRHNAVATILNNQEFVTTLLEANKSAINTGFTGIQESIDIGFSGEADSNNSSSASSNDPGDEDDELEEEKSEKKGNGSYSGTTFGD